MAKVVPSTLYQMMKLVWKDKDLVFHIEGIHSGRQAPIMYDVLRGIDFYTMELVNATGEDLAHILLACRVQDDSHCDAEEWFRTRFWIGGEIPKGLQSLSPSCRRSKAGDDEVDEYEEENEAPKYVAEEFLQFKNQPNLEETETVNLGDQECVKEVKISVHLYEDQRKDMIHLLTDYIDLVQFGETKGSEVQVQIEFKDQRLDHQTDQILTGGSDIIPDLSFVDCYAGYHQIMMDEEDVEKTTFITPWGVYHYRVMPFGLKNVGAPYMRAMTTILHDMSHKEIEVYMDDVIIKSRKSLDHLTHLNMFFDRLRRYNLKLNPAKCAFGVPADKLLGFTVSRRGVELDPSKIKAILELPPRKTKKAVMSFLGRLNQTSRFIAQSTVVFEPIFKLLKKDPSTKWTEECQNAFDTIKNSLSNQAVLVPPREGSPLLLYLSISDNAFGCNGLVKAYSPEGNANRKALKAQALADHLVQNPVDEEYEPIKTYFHDEEVSFVGEDILEEYLGWRLFFDGEENHQGKGIRAVLVSESGQHYLMAAKHRFNCTNNMAQYEACILGLKIAVDMNIHELLVIGDSNMLIHQVQGEWAVKIPKIIPFVQYVQKLWKRFHKIEFRHTPRIQNELAYAIATIA
ncbi:uncharacterized protein [Solanum lycopersicum]|uniref:uncharacterized protein n=1 Tax=Solanum lycopersicum TaxID=4081 RepID=UPI0037490BF3